MFCQSAIDSAQQDHASVVQAILEDKEAHVAKIRSLFNQFGGDGDTSVVTYAMFLRYRVRVCVGAVLVLNKT